MLLPNMFNGFYEEMSHAHNYDTRNSDTLRPKLITNDICSFSVKVQGTKNVECIARTYPTFKDTLLFQKPIATIYTEKIQ